MDWRITSRGGRESFYLLIADEPLADLKRLALSQASIDHLGEDAMLAATDPLRGVGGLSPRQATPSGGEADWLATLRERYPALRIERFELANPCAFSAFLQAKGIPPKGAHAVAAMPSRVVRRSAFARKTGWATAATPTQRCPPTLISIRSLMH